MDNQEAEKRDPCWSQKRCTITRCSAYGKDVKCWEHPNAGYLNRFCNGSMKPEFKKAVCINCFVFKNLNSL